MICSHKKHNWIATTKDGRTVTVLQNTWFFAREAACAALLCEREDLLEVKEEEIKKEIK